MYEDLKGISSLDRSPNISEENPQASSTDVDKNNISHQSPQEFRQQEFKQQEFNTNQIQDFESILSKPFKLFGTDEKNDHLISMILLDTTLCCFLQVIYNQQDDNTAQVMGKTKYKLLLIEKIKLYFQQIRTQGTIKQEIKNQNTKYSEIQFFISLYEILIGSFSHLLLNKNVNLIVDEFNEQDLQTTMNPQVQSYIEKMHIDLHVYMTSYMTLNFASTGDEHTDLSQLIDIPGYLERLIRQETKQNIEQYIKKSPSESEEGKNLQWEETSEQEETSEKEVNLEKSANTVKQSTQVQYSTVIKALSFIVDNYINTSSLIYEEYKNTKNENTKNQTEKDEKI